jgi:hypothetical protein
MEAKRSSETPALIRATRSHIPEDDILHSHCRDNIPSSTVVFVFAISRRLVTLDSLRVYQNEGY